MLAYSRAQPFGLDPHSVGVEPEGAPHRSALPGSDREPVLRFRRDDDGGPRRHPEQDPSGRAGGQGPVRPAAGRGRRTSRTVCHSLDMALEHLDKDREFLTRGRRVHRRRDRRLHRTEDAGSHALPHDDASGRVRHVLQPAEARVSEAGLMGRAGDRRRPPAPVSRPRPLMGGGFGPPRAFVAILARFMPGFMLRPMSTLVACCALGRCAAFRCTGDDLHAGGKGRHRDYSDRPVPGARGHRRDSPRQRLRGCRAVADSSSRPATQEATIHATRTAPLRPSNDRLSPIPRSVPVALVTTRRPARHFEPDHDGATCRPWTAASDTQLHDASRPVNRGTHYLR